VLELDVVITAAELDVVLTATVLEVVLTATRSLAPQTVVVFPLGA